MNQVAEIASGCNLATSALRHHQSCPMGLNAVVFYEGYDISAEKYEEGARLLSASLARRDDAVLAPRPFLH